MSRGQNRAYAVPTARSPLIRECPDCGAAKGHRCGRSVGERGWVPLAQFHKGRKKARSIK